MANINNKNNKIYSYIIVLIWLFILVLFTKSAFDKIQISADEKRIEEAKLQTARDKVQKLNEIEVKLNEEADTISKYMENFSEDEMIDYIYNEIEKKNMGWEKWIVVVRSLSIKEAVVNELWFSEVNLTLNLRVPTIERMRDTLDFFTSEDSKYKFFIDSFSLPSTIAESWFNITIPLKVFFK